MSRLSRGLDRVLGRGGMEARELHSLVQDDLISDEVLAHVVGRLGKEDLEALLGSERLRVRPMLVALSARAAGAAVRGVAGASGISHRVRDALYCSIWRRI